MAAYVTWAPAGLSSGLRTEVEMQLLLRHPNQGKRTIFPAEKLRLELRPSPSLMHFSFLLLQYMHFIVHCHPGAALHRVLMSCC